MAVDAESLKESGFVQLREHNELFVGAKQIAAKFDEIVGQAALCGTLSVPLLLQYIRPLMIDQAAPGLDDFAHMILDL